MSPHRLLIAPWVDKRGVQIWRLLHVGNWWTRVIAQDENAERVILVRDRLFDMLLKFGKGGRG